MLKVVIVYLLYFVKDASFQTCEAENQYPWSYHGTDNDPSRWGNLYPNCSDEEQSPIAFNTKIVEEGDFPAVIFLGFDKPITQAKVQNLGFTVMITPEDDVQRLIKVGIYFLELKNIRFHFGSKSNPGAEHVINGTKHVMEIQYYTVDTVDKEVGVVSSLMEVSDYDNPAFDPIIEVLPNIMYRNDSTELKSELRLLPASSYLLPSKRRPYYMYSGSNSIPPCELYFVWWILQDVGKIGRNQLDTFMTLYSVGKEDASDDCLMGPNARPPQDLGNRYIVSGPHAENDV